MSTALTPDDRWICRATGALTGRASTRWVGCCVVMPGNLRSRGAADISGIPEPVPTARRWGASRPEYVRHVPKPTRRSGNLPAEATSFVGRRHELAEVRKRL